MYKLVFMPDPDIFRDVIVHVLFSMWIEDCFRDCSIPHPSIRDWTFDGEGWSSDIVLFQGEFGRFYVTRHMD